MSTETAQLSEQLRHKQQELERLQLQDKNREQVISITSVEFVIPDLCFRPSLRCTTSWTSFLPHGKLLIVK